MAHLAVRTRLQPPFEALVLFTTPGGLTSVTSSVADIEGDNFAGSLTRSVPWCWGPGENEWALRIFLEVLCGGKGVVVRKSPKTGQARAVL